VSKGPAPIPVPNLIGLTLSEAQATVENSGLLFAVANEPVEVSAASELAGLIAAQTPPSGAELFPGDEVVVSLGVLVKVQVPDVVGKSEAEAVAELEAAGFVVEVVGTIEVAADSPLIGFVADQDPPADALIDDASTVRIWIGVAPPEEPPPDDDN
jgi:serine/threonine-protein kinase